MDIHKLVLLILALDLGFCSEENGVNVAGDSPNQTNALTKKTHKHRHRHGMNQLSKKALLRMLTQAESLHNLPFLATSSSLKADSSKQNGERRDNHVELQSTRHHHARKSKSRTSKRPNIIFILTDDQDIELGSMEYMPKTMKILGEGGVHIKNAYVTTPMCCPSRSSILTGLYVHNHNVYTNGENCSSPHWQETHERRTFATYLQSSGYRTAFFGKYLNEYNGSYIPPGWTDWSGLVRNSRYYNYTLNVNGERVRYGGHYDHDYYPDRILNDSLQYMRFSRTFFSHKPFLMVLSHPAPHGPEDSAPQYQHMFAGERRHRTKSWNFAPNADKQWLLRNTPNMSTIQQDFTDFLFTKRLQTLQSVDDAVQRIYDELVKLDEVNNTYIVYTSDHGYHLGQFGLTKGKAMPFEFDVKVPFFIAGPNLPKNETLSSIVLNIDIAPTLLDLAGLKVPSHMDGSSFLPHFKRLAQGSDARGRDSFLIERGKFKVKNSIDRLLMPIIGKKQWLRLECQKPDYQSPCVEDQKFECYLDRNGNDRIRKCKHHEDRGCTCPPHMKVKLMANDNDVLGKSKFHRGKSSRFNRYQFKRRNRRSQEHRPMFITDESTSSAEQQLSTFDINAVYQLRKFIDLARAASEKNVHNRSNAAHSAITTSELVSILDNFNKSLANDFTEGTFCNVTQSDLSIACSDETFSNQEEWEEKKEHVNTAIKLLQRRLFQLKGVRRFINNRHWNKNTKQLNQSKFKVCQCVPRNDEDTSTDVPHHRKLRKHDKKERRKAKFQNTTCEVAVNEQQMNCFTHDNDHWKTPPLWRNGPFCFCQNALNNSFWCLRTINKTSNFLYCEFVTGFITFYNMNKDPYQLRNAIFDLEFNQIEELSRQLAHLKNCAGHEQCSMVGAHDTNQASNNGAPVNMKKKRVSERPSFIIMNKQ